MYGRLSVLPDEAEPLHRSQLLAALSAGTEIIQLCRAAHRFGLGSRLDVARDAVAQGDIATATAHFAQLDAVLAARPGIAALRARGSILALVEALTQHSAYFNAGVPG